MYTIPLFDLNYDEKEIKAVTETIASKWISCGQQCIRLEEKFKEMLQVSYALAVSSCTAALHLALCALHIQEGDEVIVPSLTFVATVNAIKYVGATPVFCDIVSPYDITIDVYKIKKLITRKTKAIIVMHYGGFACHMDEIMSLARENHLYVIEDACHGPLSEYHGNKLGTIGDIGCFSFFSNKNISTGEGGMIVTNRSEVSKCVRLLRSHGMTAMSYERANGHSTTYDVVKLGFNYRMDDIRATLGVVQLEKLYTDLKRRETVRKWYIQYLQDIDKLIIPFKDCKEFSSNYIMSIVLKNSNKEERDMVRSLLKEKGIQTSVHYPAIHRFSIYSNLCQTGLGNTEYVADCEITLPMYAKLTQQDVEYICNTIKTVLKEVQI